MSEVHTPNTPHVFALKEDLTLPAMAEFRAELLAALDRSDAVVLDATRVEEVDFSFFQTLCAAHREAVERGKTLTLAPRAGRVDTLMRRGGFGRQRGCVAGCLWLEEGQ